MNDTPTFIQHCALHLVLVCVGTPVSRLQTQNSIVDILELHRINIMVYCLIHLDKSNLADANTAFKVLNGDLSVMLQVTLLTENIMDAGNSLVPLIMVSIP